MASNVEGEVPAETPHIVDEPAKLSNNVQPKKSTKESRKAEEKSIENIMKTLSNYNTPAEKLMAMCRKYNESLDENKKLQHATKQWEKKYVLTQREKDHIQAEHNKTVLLKSKLESLCRELQKQIKTVKEESMVKIKEEEEKRKETLAMFQKTISEVTAAMQQNNEKNNKLRDDNLDMTEKFKSIMQQYELREHEVDKITKQMALEAQLSEAKLAKIQLEAQTEKEKLLAEKKQLLIDLTQYQARVNELQATEVSLRSQIAMYTDKYDEFQNALTKSNEVFGGFKGEMEKMSKKVLKQEKEAVEWKSRWEKSHTALLDIASEKQQMESKYVLQTKQLTQLQKLCRTMQAERTVLLNVLKDNNIERPPLPQLPPEPKPIQSEGVDKMDLMAANCAQLKKSLSQLQGQLNDLTNKKAAEGSLPKTNNDNSNEESAKTTSQKKSKKGKGKKSKVNQTDSEENKNKPEDALDGIDRLAIPPKCPLFKHLTDQIKDGFSNTTPSVDLNGIGDSQDSVVTPEVSESQNSNSESNITNGNISPKEASCENSPACESVQPVENEVITAVNSNMESLSL